MLLHVPYSAACCVSWTRRHDCAQHKLATVAECPPPLPSPRGIRLCRFHREHSLAPCHQQSSSSLDTPTSCYGHQQTHYPSMEDKKYKHEVLIKKVLQRVTRHKWSSASRGTHSCFGHHRVLSCRERERNTTLAAQTPKTPIFNTAHITRAIHPAHTQRCLLSHSVALERRITAWLPRDSLMFLDN